MPRTGSSVPSDESLTVQCVTPELPLSATLRAEVEPALSAFVELSLLEFSLSAPIDRFKFTSSTSSLVLRARREIQGVKKGPGRPPSPFFAPPSSRCNSSLVRATCEPVARIVYMNR